ncbi:MAG: 50S ribosomal protein L6 [Thermoprotei archaeon]
MPKTLTLTKVVVPPNGVKLEVQGEREIHAEGPKGKLTLRLPSGNYSIEQKEKGISVVGTGLKKEDAAMFGTVVALINNTAKGVLEGYEKTLVVAYSHFPMNVHVDGDKVVVENFIGERGKRYGQIVGDTKVEVNGDIIRVSGPDKHAVGQTAANIIRACKLTGYDRRVFQDGIFLKV